MKKLGFKVSKRAVEIARKGDCAFLTPQGKKKQRATKGKKPQPQGGGSTSQMNYSGFEDVKPSVVTIEKTLFKK